MLTIWHNQRCSKSREVMSIINDLGVDSEVVKYLEEDITKDDIKELLKKLGIAPRELMRTKEDIYKELNLADEMDEQKLIDAMVAYPRLIERPIIIKNDKAIIGRPVDKVLPFLNL